jgi:DNA-binding transcriptional LysR family regulator
MLNLRQIRYFVEIAETENFRKASQKLRIAQPALSRQMTALAEELGVELFVRLPRGVRLTYAGQVFQRHCRQILAEVDSAVEEVRGAWRGLSGQLKLGFIEVAALSEIMPHSLSSFRKAVPEVELDLHAMASLAQIEEVRNRRLDGGFLYNPPAWDNDVVSRPLERHPVYLAVPDASPLATRPSVRLDDLRNESFLWFHRAVSPTYHDQLGHVMQQAQFQPRIVHQSESEAVMLALVRMGQGIAFVNARQARRRPDGVTLLPVEDLPVWLDLHFVWRKDSVSPALRRFIDMLEHQSPASGAAGTWV